MGLGAVEVLGAVTENMFLFEVIPALLYLILITEQGFAKPREKVAFAVVVIGIGVVYPSALIVYLVHALIDPVAPTLVIPFMIVATSMIALALSSLVIIAGFVNRRTLTLLALTAALTAAAEAYLAMEIQTILPPYVYCNYCM